jgi:hypothetical protein
VDFDSKEIVVDPIEPMCRPGRQFELTKGKIIHEAGHIRYTSPIDEPNVAVKWLTNLLEDQRIERRLIEVAFGTQGYLDGLKRYYRRKIPKLTGSRGPREVLLALLQLRFRDRLKGKLIKANQSRLRRILPLVDAAIASATTEEVHFYAKAIVQEIGLKSRSADLEILSQFVPFQEQVGKRGDSPDIVERGGFVFPTIEDTGLEALLPSLIRNDQIVPKPCSQLLDLAAIYAGILARGLEQIGRIQQMVPSSHGTRLSIRFYIWNKSKPFVKNQEIGSGLPSLALGCLVDCSGSMKSSMDDVRLSVMVLHLTCVRLQLSHGIWAFSSWQEPIKIVKDFSDPAQYTPAYIAGLESSSGTELLPALDAAIPKILARHEKTKLLLVIHDGFPSHFEKCKKYITKITIPTVIGVCLSSQAEDCMKELFGNRLVVSPPENLARTLTNFLQPFYRT